MFYSVYQITNIISKKIYIGVHKTINPYDDYMGSGKAIKNAIKKYGKHNFVKIILFLFDNKNEAYQREKELIDQNFINSKNTYNLKLGGCGGWDHVRTPEIKKLAIENLKKFYNTKEGKELRKKTIEARKNIPPHNKGKKWTEECYKNNDIIGRRKNTIFITNDQTTKVIKNNEKIPEGWRRGRCVRKNISFNKYLLKDQKGNDFIIENLKDWCIENNFNYDKIFPYIGKGVVKMIERYRSPEREWFVGKSLQKIDLI